MTADPMEPGITPALASARWVARGLEASGWAVEDVSQGATWEGTVVIATKGGRWALFSAHGVRLVGGRVRGDGEFEGLSIATARSHRDARHPIHPRKKAKAKGGPK